MAERAVYIQLDEEDSNLVASYCKTCDSGAVATTKHKASECMIQALIASCIASKVSNEIAARALAASEREKSAKDAGKNMAIRARQNQNNNNITSKIN